MNIALNQENFEYDVRSLVQSFYPGEKANIKTAEALREEGLEPDISVELNDNGIAFYYRDEAPETLLYSDIVPGDAAKEFKWEFKRRFYRLLSVHTKKTLPWGALIGIRPTKLAMDMLKSGVPEEEIPAKMKEKYLLSDEKAALCLEIASREKKILDGLTPEKGYSLYIGIPFCPSTCLYCSFTSYPISVYEKKGLVDEYLSALMKEITETRELMKGCVCDTIYIGGGTPSSLSADRLDRLLTHIESLYDVTALREFTVEAGRADSITRDKLKVMKAHHVSRISVNPQTMKDETLKLIGRHHNAEDVREAFKMAREEGFDNINMDLILGLPGEGPQDVRYTMEQVSYLSPENVTVHSLAIKRASKMGDFIREKGFEMISNTDETMKIASEACADMGLKPYYLYRQKNMSGNFENTGFAREGKNGIYNILIMEEVQSIIACGAGTISKRVYPDGRIERCDNVKDVPLYIKDIDEMIERKKKLFLA